MDVQLYRFPGSNACLTVELLLDHAGIAWRERRLPPGLHAALLRLHGFDRPTVPAAVIDDTRVQGSRPIARHVADARPGSGLLPSAGADRERVLELERLAERLQDAARRLVYVVAQDDPDLVLPLVRANFPRLPRPAAAVVARGLVAGGKYGHGARRDRVEHELGRARESLDALDAGVREGLLGGDRPTVADFQAAPNLALLAATPQLAPVLHARPSWVIADRWCPSYPLDVTADVPEGWASALAPG